MRGTSSTHLGSTFQQTTSHWLTNRYHCLVFFAPSQAQQEAPCQGGDAASLGSKSAAPRAVSVQRFYRALQVVPISRQPGLLLFHLAAGVCAIIVAWRAAAEPVLSFCFDRVRPTARPLPMLAGAQ